MNEVLHAAGRGAVGAMAMTGMLVIWLGFELFLAPVLGLSQAKKPRPVDRLGLAADHLLYGLVLNQGRRRPQESSA